MAHTKQQVRHRSLPGGKQGSGQVRRDRPRFLRHPAGRLVRDDHRGRCRSRPGHVPDQMGPTERSKLMHPVYRKRCERDGFEMETMWLGEEDIEPDDGTQVSLEQPTQIKTLPLSEKDQDDRVRMALGLTHDDPLPEISLETLLTYHRYLTLNQA